MDDQVRWFVGFDWASKLHHVCLLDAEGRPVAERQVKHGGAELSELCAWLIEKTQANPAEIAVAIETPRGPVVEVLLERGFKVFSVNPKQLDRFRDRFTVAGAKDDSRDALVLGTSLRSDPRAFRPLRIEDPLVIQLREWLSIHDELVQEQNRLTNRMESLLWRYYPNMAELTEDLAAAWFIELWEKLPTPAKAAQASEKSVARILKSHRVRRIDAAEVLRILRRPALQVAPGATEAASAHIGSIVVRLRVINQQIKEADRRLDELCAAIEANAESTPGQICGQRDVAILRSLPGLGRVNIAALLGEVSEPLRQRNYHILRMLSGVAPVTRRSGKSYHVQRRRACNIRLRDALYHWSRVAIQYDAVSKRRYGELRRRGHSHGRALRTVGDRLLYLLCTLLERQTLFDPDYKTAQQSNQAT
jgi:transposase